MIAALLDPEAIHEAIASEWRDDWGLEVVQETRSTNDAILELTTETPFRALFAEQQTHGRGRRGNEWFSGGPGENLIMSCAYACPWPLPHWNRLTNVVALAVKRTLDDLPPARPLVKWPNDIFLGHRKVAGILIETKVSTGQHSPLAVLGIGINANGSMESMPEPITSTATSIRDVTGTIIDRNLLAATILSQLSAALQQAQNHFADQIDELRQAAYLTGKLIRARLPNGEVRGLAEGLSDEGELLVRLDDGSLRAITSAEEVRVV